MTKRLILLPIIYAISMLQIAFAQDVFQLTNAGFEEWENGSTSKPVAWNTYETAQGSLAGVAGNSNQCKKSTDVRPGSNGSFSVSAISRSVLGISANGIITSGVINAGATSADNPQNNNQTVPGDSDKSMKFTGRPDSVVAWIKAKPKDSKQTGRFYIILHDNSNFQDPVNSSSDWNKVSAVAGVNPPANSNWVRYACPFYYYGETHKIAGGDRTPGLKLTANERPYYVLATISTNYLAGKGSAGDEIYVDDIEMIYNSKLKSLKYNGSDVAGFSKDVYSYVVEGEYSESAITCESDGRYATIEKNYDESTGVLTITVKGDDYSVTPTNMHTYTVSFVCKAKLNNFAIDGVALADFSSEKLEYTIDRVYNNVKSKITYSVPGCASVSEVWDEATNTLKMTVTAADTKVYSFNFHAPYGSKLKSLSIAGKEVAGFSPDVLGYTVANTYDATQLSIVADDDATFETSFDKSTYILTITVKGKDFYENANNINHYRIQYHAPYGSILTDLKVNGKTVANFSSATTTYSVPDVYTPDVTWSCSEEATVESSYDASTRTLTIVVKGGDIAVNESNTNTYKITFHDSYGSQLTSLSVNRQALAGFSPDVYVYKVAESYSDGMVMYEGDKETSVSSSFDSETNRFIIEVKGGDFATNSENKNTYTIQFCAKSFLTSLKYDGVTVPTFRSEKYAYDMSSYSYEADKISYSSSNGAVVDLQYDSETSLLTIVVSGSDLDLFPDNKHTYTIQFHASYSSFLTSLSVDGALIEGFAKTNYEYLIRGTYDAYEDRLDYVADKDARVKSTFNEEKNLLTLEVSGADVSTNPTNKHAYTIQFYAPSTLVSLKVNGLNVEGFSPDKYEYSMGSLPYENAKIIYYTAADAVAEKSYIAEENALLITVKGSDIESFADNYHTYRLQFGKALTSQLVDLKINGSTIEGFDRNKFEYIVNEFYSEGIVSYVADSAATVVSSYDTKSFTLTLRVEGGDYATNSSNSHTYTIAFNDPTVYGSQLQSLTVNGVQIEGFSKDVFEYSLDGSYSNMKIKYMADDLAVVSESFDTESNSLVITVKGGNIQKDPSNYHTYTLKFSTTFVFEALVTSISVNGGAVEAFDSSKFNYSIAENYSEADVALEVSALAQYCADYDKTTGVLTIVVWAGDFETNTTNFNTYKITFKK